jgi:hypothetical protein
MDAKKQVAVPQEQSRFWKLFYQVWANVLRPLATGIVYGCGSMLGMCFVRFFVMERLGIVAYKEFTPPKGTVPFFEPQHSK